MTTTADRPIAELPLLRRGSVKNLRGGLPNPNWIAFEFTNDFSVFDWGKLPDEIPGKGDALLGLAAHLFRELSHPSSWRSFFASDVARGFLAWSTERAGATVIEGLRRELESIGLRSCFRGVYRHDGRDQGLVVENLPMIPLEVVFRHALTDRSSYFDRYPNTPLRPGHRFETPLVEFFTKLEPIDRFLPTREEACAIGGITAGRLLELELRTELLALWLARECRLRDLDLIDGKFEWGQDAEGRIVLADAIGPDELRLMEMRPPRDAPAASAPARLSKEFLREYYRDSAWFAEVQAVKRRAGARPLEAGWQKTVTAPPPMLPREALEQASALYDGLERRFRPANVLLVGSGGREHAIARKLCESPNLRTLYWVPGQPAGLAALRAQLAKAGFPHADRKRVTGWTGAAFDPRRPDETAFAELRAAGVSLVVLSQDADLAAGAADAYRAAGFPVFGPSRAAARVEWSKSFMKEICAASGTPTAKAHAAASPEEAIALLERLEWPTNRGWVVKADGLAAGKGVVVAETREEATAAVAELCRFGERFVIEERLTGEESSWFAFADGDAFSLLDPARDYKRLRDGQTGPNTGGMGAVSPAPGATPELRERVRAEIFRPILDELRRRGIRYRGLLYAGLMIDGARGPAADARISLLELNARFGDPETQALLPRMRGDLLEWCFATATGALRRMPRDVPFSDETAVFVVAAAPGYPDRPELGAPVDLSEDLLAADAFRFAGLRADPGGWRVDGGRVLGALGTGRDPADARAEAYRRLEPLLFAGAQVRKDIGL